MPRNTHRQVLTDGKLIAKQLKQQNRYNARAARQNAGKHDQDAHYSLPKYDRVDRHQSQSDNTFNDGIDDFIAQKTYVGLDNDQHDDGEKDVFDDIGSEYSSDDNESEVIDLSDPEALDDDIAAYDHDATNPTANVDSDGDDRANWGASRSINKLTDTYYGTDTVDYELFETPEDQELVEAEQAEALSIQRQILQSIDNSAIDDEMRLLDMVNGVDGVNKQRRDIDIDDDELAGDIGDFDTVDEKSRLHTIPTEPQSLSNLIANSPDVAALVTELQKRSAQLEQLEIDPVFELMVSGDAGTVDPTVLTYMTTLHQLLTQYCSIAAFCLTLYADGKYVATHPVVPQIRRASRALTKLDKLNVTMQKQMDAALLSRENRTRSVDALTPRAVKPKAKSIRRDSAATPKPSVFIKRKIIAPALPVLHTGKRSQTDDSDAVNVDASIVAKKQKRLQDELAMKRLKSTQKADKTVLNTDGISDGELNDAYDDYNSAKHAQKQKRVGKHFDLPEDGVTRGERKPWRDPDLVSAEERRAATYTILKNKGLTRYRSKASANPRVKSRLRYEKGLAKQRSRVQQFGGKQVMNYSGEATGIKRNTVKSTKL